MKPFQLIKSAGVEVLGTEIGDFSLYFSSRRGGFSKAPFNTLNLSFQVGDEQKAVVNNRKKLAEALELSIGNFITLHQMHSSQILKVSLKEANSFLSEKVTAKGDALITSDPVALTLFYADCLPIFLIEPQRKVAGLIHAGWRGLKEQIAKKTVEEMVMEFGILPENLFAWLGPSIDHCCYQVSSDFLDYFQANPESVKKTIDGRVFLNLKSIGYAQLRESGVKKENIKTVPYCTSCQKDFFFSYRRENGETGRQAAILVLRKK